MEHLQTYTYSIYNRTQECQEAAVRLFLLSGEGILQWFISIKWGGCKKTSGVILFLFFNLYLFSEGSLRDGLFSECPDHIHSYSWKLPSSSTVSSAGEWAAPLEQIFLGGLRVVQRHHIGVRKGREVLLKIPVFLITLPVQGIDLANSFSRLQATTAPSLFFTRVSVNLHYCNTIDSFWL